MQQDTPQFDTIKQQFQAFSRTTLIEDTTYPINNSELIKIIDEILNTIILYFNDKNFRDTLTLQGKLNIESQIQSIIAQFSSIRDFRNNGTLGQQEQNLTTNLSSFLEELRVRFINTYKLYVLEGRTDLSQFVEQIKNNVKDSSKAKDEVFSVLELAQAAVEKKGADAQANFFHKNYNGRTVEEQEIFEKRLPRNPFVLKKEHVFLYLLAVLFFGSNAQNIVDFFKNLTNKAIYGWCLAVLAILVPSIGLIIIKVTKRFNRNYPAGYERAAKIWGFCVGLSVAFLAAYSYYVVSSLDLKNFEKNISIEEAIIKAVVLVAPAYFIRFTVRNFNANKHLATLNLHRAASIRVAELFIKGMNKDNEIAYVELIKILFTQEETGFITRRDGAGDSDTNIAIPASR